jgi:hypothetical protein
MAVVLQARLHVGSIASRAPSRNLRIRMVAGCAELPERKEFLVAGVRFELRNQAEQGSVFSSFGTALYPVHRQLHGQFLRALAKVGLVVVVSLTARRTGQFPTTNHHKANEISRGLRRRHKHPENYAVATLRVFALDPKLLLFGHVDNLGGARAQFQA